MEFTIQTSQREECVDIHSKIQEMVDKSGVRDGVAIAYVVHATAALIINENADPNIQDDFIAALGKLVPHGAWKHDKLDGNADAHIKASILGPSETIFVKDGKLVLGTWQSPMLVELDGPRERKILVTVISVNSGK